MIDGVSLGLAVALLGTPTLLLFMFLPTLLEIRKPRDCGPRVILPDLLLMEQKELVFLLLDMEAYEAKMVKPRLGTVLGALPSLEP